ncbi:anti-sigma factor [Erythrobacter sp.]|jgi:anti-sigma-K factor RskA|uniref:anti-sigma factor n=1 Tax=Erythrobacter sp. TaxID=1042 RepID=UPI002EA5D21B|nr:anti-sigma factor [Erythrobacter sp.]
MSGDDTTPRDIERDDPLMAAEHALGLLENEELRASKAKIEADGDYAWRKDWWDGWFAPWTDEIAAAEPDGEVWRRIEREMREMEAESELLAAPAAQHAVVRPAPRDNVVDLTARLRGWQWTAGITSAAAAVLLALLLFSPGTEPAPGATPGPAIAAADPLVAQVPIGETGLRLDVTYIPQSEEILVGAVGLTADGVHDHELWLVPGDGSALQSLGVVAPGEVRSVAIPDEIAQNLGAGVGLVLTREPIGGKPEGEDAGPVVAEGAFSAI